MIQTKIQLCWAGFLQHDPAAEIVHSSITATSISRQLSLTKTKDTFEMKAFFHSLAFIQRKFGGSVRHLGKMTLSSLMEASREAERWVMSGEKRANSHYSAKE
jgi:hypothetical protein